MDKRKLEELNLLDDFLFGAVMTHPEVGERFVRSLLECVFDREFPKLKLVGQKTYGALDTDMHGARLDVYVEEEEYQKLDEVMQEKKEGIFVYDLEAERENHRKKQKIAGFPKRTRYYHATIDSHGLRSGEEYEKLKNVIVLFFCDYDPFGYDRVKYTIENRCREELDMPYEDGAKTIVLYTRGTKGDVPEKLRQLLRYMEHTTWENAVNETLKEMQKMVEIVKVDRDFSISYRKKLEREAMIRDEVREEERQKVEAERQRAEKAEEKIVMLEEMLRKYQEG